MLNSTHVYKSLLLKVAWVEAYHLGPMAMEMVAQCLANRVRAGWGSWAQVLAGMGKYSAHYPAQCNVDLMEANNPVFGKLLVAIDGIYENTRPNLTGGDPGTGFYWAELDKITRPWFQENVVGKPREHPRQAQMGTFCIWG